MLATVSIGVVLTRGKKEGSRHCSLHYLTPVCSLSPAQDPTLEHLTSTLQSISGAMTLQKLASGRWEGGE